MCSLKEGRPPTLDPQALFPGRPSLILPFHAAYASAHSPWPGTARNTLNQPAVWLAILLCLSLCVLPVIGVRFLMIQLKPTISDQVTPHRPWL